MTKNKHLFLNKYLINKINFNCSKIRIDIVYVLMFIIKNKRAFPRFLGF